MSQAEESVGAAELSFERAELPQRSEPELPCGYCRKPIRSEYWQIAKRPACAECRTVVEREIATSQSPARFFAALRLGGLAAVAGCIAWIVISKVTGYEIGIVAIAIGYFVGTAVRKGSGNLGGPRYQALAVFLTYSAIALASLPGLIQAIAHSSSHGASAAVTHPGFGALLWAWLLLIGIAYASPFLAGAQNFLGIIIIGIGLYEAWKLTRPMPMQVLGPYTLKTSAPAPSVASADAAP